MGCANAPLTATSWLCLPPSHNNHIKFAVARLGPPLRFGPLCEALCPTRKWKLSEFLAVTTFLSGLGLGGVITFLIKHSLEQKSKVKEIWLLDYKTTCDGLLDSYKQVALTGSQTALKDFAFYQLKLQLYANKEVLDASEQLKNSEAGTTERDNAVKSLLRAMRNDLGLA